MKLELLIAVIAVVASLARDLQAQLLTTFNLPGLSEDPLANVKEDLNDGRLILTPYLEAGQYSIARNLAKVDGEHFLNTTSYAGYLTVDPQHNSNLFFWFFPSNGHGKRKKTPGIWQNYQDTDDAGEMEDTDYDHMFLKKFSVSSTERPVLRPDDKPLVLWLQGGPGMSSLMALFAENGPFVVDDRDSLKLKENPYSWHRHYHMLYIDNPVGTGFSFTSPKGYCRNATQVAKHMHTALGQFFKLFPHLKTNNFYIAGESYAGKYIPAIGHEIYKENGRLDNPVKINLRGLAIGNGLTDPINMISYSDYAYQLGLIGRIGYREMQITENLVRKNYHKPRLAKAYWDATLHLFTQHSNYTNLYNIEQVKEINLFPYLDFIKQKKITLALHVGGQPFAGPNRVYTHLVDDFMTSSIPWIEKLLDAGLRILFYNGNWDFIVAYALSENAFHRMNWSGSTTYEVAARKPFMVNRRLAGYVTSAFSFYEAAILNAGHMVPADQPEVCLQLIDSFIHDRL